MRVWDEQTLPMSARASPFIGRVRPLGPLHLFNKARTGHPDFAGGLADFGGLGGLADFGGQGLADFGVPFRGRFEKCFYV